jgi:hypothetical protein
MNNTNANGKKTHNLQQKQNILGKSGVVDLQQKQNYLLKSVADVQQKQNYSLKSVADVQKKQNYSLKSVADVQKNKNILGKPGLGDVQKNKNILGKPGLVNLQQKQNYSLKSVADVQQKQNILGKPGLGDVQKKNNGLTLKGDMDGLGKEKGNYTTRFVYLYKQKFHDEAIHNKHDMNGLSPLSGYEPTYNPNYWNNNKNIKNNNNCYSYSVNYKNHKYGKPQPGYFSKFNHIQNKQYKCVSFFKRILNDIPSVYLTSFKQKCKNGFHKAFFAIDSNKNEHDYHFYRQDNNQLWSHKPGTTNVINYDSDYKIIKNPYTANRNYIHYNYDKPCFFFCVNNKFGKTNAK